MAKLLRNLIQYGITPVFLVMAFFNFFAEQQGGGHHGGHDMAGHSMQSVAMDPVVSPLITSMGVMYLLMALAHVTPWLPKGEQAQSNDIK